MERKMKIRWARVISSWVAAVLIQIPIYVALGVEFVKSPFLVILGLWMAVAAAVIVFFDELETQKKKRKSARKRGMTLVVQV